jgi:hypothetical protein
VAAFSVLDSVQLSLVEPINITNVLKPGIEHLAVGLFHDGSTNAATVIVAGLEREYKTMNEAIIAEWSNILKTGAESRDLPPRCDGHLDA